MCNPKSCDLIDTIEDVAMTLPDFERFMTERLPLKVERVKPGPNVVWPRLEPRDNCWRVGLYYGGQRVMDTAAGVVTALGVGDCLSVAVYRFDWDIPRAEGGVWETRDTTRTAGVYAKRLAERLRDGLQAVGALPVEPTPAQASEPTPNATTCKFIYDGTLDTFRVMIGHLADDWRIYGGQWVASNGECLSISEVLVFTTPPGEPVNIPFDLSRDTEGVTYCIESGDACASIVARGTDGPLSIRIRDGHDPTPAAFPRKAPKIGAAFNEFRDLVIREIWPTETTLTQDDESGAGKGPGFVNTIVHRIDKLENNLGGKIDDLKQGQIAIYRCISRQDQAILETILEEIRQQRIEQDEMQSTLDAIRRVLKYVQETGFSVDDSAIRQSLTDIYTAINSDLSFRQQLELSIPVIPFLLEYKVGLDAGVDLEAIWKELVERVQTSRSK